MNVTRFDAFRDGSNELHNHLDFSIGQNRRFFLLGQHINQIFQPLEILLIHLLIGIGNRLTKIRQMPNGQIRSNVLHRESLLSNEIGNGPLDVLAGSRLEELNLLQCPSRNNHCGNAKLAILIRIEVVRFRPLTDQTIGAPQFMVKLAESAQRTHITICRDDVPGIDLKDQKILECCEFAVVHGRSDHSHIFEVFFTSLFEKHTEFSFQNIKDL